MSFLQHTKDLWLQLSWIGFECVKTCPPKETGFQKKRLFK